jgi:hypothetical protein
MAVASVVLADVARAGYVHTALSRRAAAGGFM